MKVKVICGRLGIEFKEDETITKLKQNNHIFKKYLDSKKKEIKLKQQKLSTFGLAKP